MGCEGVTLPDGLAERLVEMRRDFHRHAESAWMEFRTAALVVRRLTELDYQVQYGEDVLREQAMMGVPPGEEMEKARARALEGGADPGLVAAMEGGKTAVVGLFDTGREGPTVGLRFDMDANDVQEALDEEHRPFREGFASISDGVMHACGHDAHTAIGLGFAEVIADRADELCGRIKLIFQPAEEGVRGARAMAEAGVVDDVDYLIGFHLGLKCSAGEVVAGSEGFLATMKADVTFSGVPAHAGVEPESGTNALLAAATAALGLHAISRHSEGATRVNVGTLHAGSGRNVIPSRARMTIETRGATTELNDFMWARALEVLDGAAAMYGVEHSVDLVGAAMGGQSTGALAKRIAEVARGVRGITDVQTTGDFGGSEDYTYMMNRVQERGGQASYVVLGTTLGAGHHNSYFDIDEDVLPLGVQLLTGVALALGAAC